MQSGRMRCFWAAGSAGLLLATQAAAQTTGGLSGQIFDANTQAPVRDAVVVAQSPSLQGEQTAVTDSTGSFSIALLPAGTYSLTVQREGYNPFTKQGLTVDVDKIIHVKLQLVPDTVLAGVVEIVAQRPVIASNSVQTGQTISKEQMNLIPYGRNSRGFEAVAAAVPGVHADTFGFQVNGAGSPENNYVIDGVSVSDPAYGTQGTSLIQDFVQEVDVKTGGYQAEYGRASGGILNAVTKSGGNELHGSVFGHLSPFEASRKTVGSTLAVARQSSQRYNLDFGAEVGGPILKDKLWFFAGFAPQFVATNNDRIIQAQVDDGSGSAVLGSDGQPVVREVARRTYASTQSSYQYTGKLTYLLDENHTVSAAVYGNPSRISGAPNFGNANNAVLTLNGNEGTFLTDQSFGSFDGTVRYAGKLLDRSMLVEANLGFHRQSGTGSQNNYGLTEVQGVSAQTLRNTPAIQFRGTSNLLNPLFNDGTQPGYQGSPQVVAACQPAADGFNPCPVINYNTGGIGFLQQATLTRFSQQVKLTNFLEWFGHHLVKYGADLAEDRYDNDKTYTGGQQFFAVGGYYVAVRGYGHGSASNASVPALDPSSTQPFAFLDAELHKITKNFSAAFFLQDTWSILDRVTLDVGLRVEAQKISPADRVLDANGNVVAGPSISLTNAMPRLGLAYDPTGRGLSKVYASFGRFYEYIPLDLADRSLSNEQSVGFITNGSSCRKPTDPRTCALVPGSYSFAGSAEGVDPNLKGQYSDEYQAGAQYQIYRDVVVGVDYVRKQIGRVVEDMSVDDGATYFLSNPGEPGARGYSAVLGNGTVVVEPKPKRIYDGLTLSARKQFSENYLLTASYVYSSLRGNYPGLFRGTGQLDPNITTEYDLISLLGNRYGPLSGDVSNQFKLDGAYVYELNVDNSLNLGATFQLSQGTPYDVLGAHPIYGNGQAFILPRGSGGRLPWNNQLDVRAALAHRISSAYGLQVEVDLFNVTNRQQVLSVDQNYTFDAVNPIINGTRSDLQYLRNTAGTPVTRNPTYGQPLSYQLPFSARFGARLTF